MDCSESLVEQELLLHFWDRKPEMSLAWITAFPGTGPWQVGVGSITDKRGDAAVSPANSHGYMDGGVDLAYRATFGLSIENTVRAVIEKKYGGLMPIGTAFIVNTGHGRIPRLIVAPTMERPQDISETDNVYRAMRAILEEALLFNHEQRARGGETIRKVLIPGMGTGVGMMNPFIAAEQMRKAFDDVRAELLAHRNDLGYLQRRG